jgi:hypothetical protein
MKNPAQIIISCLFVLLTIVLNAQDFEAAFSFGSNGAEEANCIKADNNGNFFITGNFENTVDFDLSTGEALLTAAGGYDAYIAKYDDDAGLLWAISISGSGYIYGRAIDCDDDGNVYVIGYYKGQADFDPSSGEYLLTSNGETDCFFAKYDSDGNLSWAYSIGDLNFDSGHGIAIDGDAVLVTGIFQGSIDFDFSSGIHILTDHGRQDIFVAKYSLEGDFINAVSLGGDQSTFIIPQVCSRSGEIYVSGTFNNSIDLDPGTGTLMVNSNGMTDFFLVKLDEDMNLSWGFSFGAEGEDIIRDVYAGDDHVLIAGLFSNKVDFDPSISNEINLKAQGDYDGFVASYTLAGECIWANQISGPNVQVKEITEDEDEYIYAIGEFYGTTDFDPSAVIYNLTPFGNWDGFAARYDASGNFEWALHMGSNDHDYGSSITLFDDEDFVMVCGKFQGFADFDSNGSGYILSSSGSFDAFVALYGCREGSSVPSLSNNLNEVRLYPNPVEDMLNIELGEDASYHHFSILNLIGQQVKSGKLHTGINSIVLGDLDAGIYFISLESTSQRMVKKIMISK